jgi:glutathione S-transferase
MKLYYAPGACSLAAHICMRETGTSFEGVKVDLRKHVTEDGADFYAINPKGGVPTLELDNGERLTEVAVVCTYVCDRSGRVDLMPDWGSFARYRVMEWLNYVATELHKGFGAFFNPQLGDDVKRVFAEVLERKFAWVSGQLEGRKFLTGDEFTAADAYLFAIARWAPGMKVDISSCTHLNAFRERVAVRPAVAEALRVEGLA